MLLLILGTYTLASIPTLDSYKSTAATSPITESRNSTLESDRRRISKSTGAISTCLIPTAPVIAAVLYLSYF